MEIKDYYWVNDKMRVGWVSTFMLQGGKPRDQVRLPEKSAGEVWKERKEPSLQVLRSYAGATREGPQI